MTQLLGGGWHPAFSLPGYGLIAVAALLSWWPARRMEIPGRAIDCLAAGALLFACVALRALFSPEAYLARNDLYMALAAMTLYLLVSLSLTSSKWRGMFIGFLLLLGFANCVVGIVQFAKSENFSIFSFLPRPDYGSRASGFYGYPNHLALFLEICVLMGFSMAFWSQWRPWMKMLAGYVSLVCALGLLFTGSRGGYAGAAGGMLVFGLLSLRIVGKLGLNRAIILLAVGLLIFTGLGLGVEHVLSKSTVLHERVEQHVKSGDTRLELWKAAWKQFTLKPVVGAGSGTSVYYERKLNRTVVGSDPVHVHNEYLEMLAEYGILGIVGALMFLDCHLRSGWKWISRQIARQPDSLSMGGDSLAITVGAMSSLAACIVHSGTDFTLHIPANMLTMAFVCGVLASSGSARESASETAESSDSNVSPYFRLALPALALWLGLRALPTWPAEYFSFQARLITSDSKYMESGEEARALEDLVQRGLQWDPLNPILRRYAGVAQTALAAQATDAAMQEKWAHQALAAYEEAEKLAPGDVYGVLNLAWEYENQQRYADAGPLFKRAVELDPTSSNAHYAYASHLHAQGKLAEAATEYQSSIKLGGGLSAQMGFDRLTNEMKAGSTGAPALPEAREPRP